MNEAETRAEHIDAAPKAAGCHGAHGESHFGNPMRLAGAARIGLARCRAFIDPGRLCA
jgi:hypothetical protein